jgi:PKD repeat protein
MKKISYICLLIFALLGSKDIYAQGSYNLSYNVTSTANAGAGTLRDAITQAMTIISSGGTGTFNILLNAPSYCQISTALPPIILSDGVSIIIQKDPAASVDQGIQYRGVATDNTYYYGLYIKYASYNASATGVPFLQIYNLKFVDFKCYSSGLNTYPIYSELFSDIVINNCEFINDQSLISINVGIKDVFKGTKMQIVNNTFNKYAYSHCVNFGNPLNFSGATVIYHNTAFSTERLFISSNNFINNSGVPYPFVNPHGAVTLESVEDGREYNITSNQFSNGFQMGLSVYGKVPQISDYNGLFNVSTNTFTGCSQAIYMFNPQLFYNVQQNVFVSNDIDIKLSSTLSGIAPGNALDFQINANNNFTGHTNIISPQILVQGYVRTQLYGANLSGFVKVDGPNAYCSIDQTTIVGAPIDKPIQLSNNANNVIDPPSLFNIRYIQSGIATVIYSLDGSAHNSVGVGDGFLVEFYLSNTNGDLISALGQDNIPYGPIVNKHKTLNSPGISVGTRIALKVTHYISGYNNKGYTSKVIYGEVHDNFCCDAVIFQPTLGQSVVNNEEFQSLIVCKSASVTYNPSTINCTNGITYTWDFGDGTLTVINSTPDPVQHIYSSVGTYFTTLTVGGNGCNADVFTSKVIVYDCCCSNPSQASITVSLGGGNLATMANVGGTQVINYFAANCGTGSPVSITPTYNWDFGDGTTSTLPSGTHQYANLNNYTIIYTQNIVGCPPYTQTLTIGIPPDEECTTCIGSFAPPAGDYIIGIWVKEANENVKTYTHAGVKISFTADPTVFGPFFPDVTKNKIIDGWQRIEEKFTVPVSATQIIIELVNTSNSADVHFDDIRVHPFNGSMKSFVYDPVNLRLMAELDENNYATMYEYDEEGKLIRVKKETERGIMTIKESRQNSSK